MEDTSGEGERRGNAVKKQKRLLLVGSTIAGSGAPGPGKRSPHVVEKKVDAPGKLGWAATKIPIRQQQKKKDIADEQEENKGRPSQKEESAKMEAEPLSTDKDQQVENRSDPDGLGGSDSPGPSGQSQDGADAIGGIDEDLQAGQTEEKGKQSRKARSKKLSKEKLEKLNEKYRKRGVVYISRIPPHLKPLKLRHMLEPHGEVLRIYLAPEDSAIRLRRKRAGGDSGKNFTEGWVEFAKKSVAKRVAEMLNGQPMGGPRRSAYHYDLWNLKYLHKFKWDNLTEEIAYRNAVREQRLAAEISSAKRERDFYLSKVDQSRAFAAMDERRKKRKTEAAPSNPSGKNNTVSTPREEAVKVRRRFPQRTAVATSKEEPRPLLPSSILSKVFSSNP